MNKIATLITVFGLSIGASAQSYDQLWKEAKTHADNDLPKSAVGVVEKIQQKALAENNDTQLLRATLVRRMLDGEVSPDSAQVWLERMEQALAAEQAPVMQALWHAALARCYEETNYGQVMVLGGKPLTYDDLQKRAKQHYEASLANLEVLADARIKNYLPLFTPNKGSDYYDNDLLHVLYNDYCESGTTDEAEELAMTNRMVQFYKSRHADDAVVLLSLKALRQCHEEGDVSGYLEDNVYYQGLVKLLNNYADAKACIEVYEAIVALKDNYGEDDETYTAHNDSVLMAQAEQGIARYKKGDTANALRNFVTRMTTPAVRVEELQQVGYPGTKSTIIFKTRHLREAELRLTRLPQSAAEVYQMDQKELATLAKRAGDKERTIVRLNIANQAAPYEWRTDSVAFETPDAPGIYYVEMLGGGKMLESTTMAVSTLTAVRLALPGRKTRVTVVDSRTGQPVAGAKVTAYRYSWGEKLRQLKSYVTDDEGNLVVTSSRTRDMQLYAATTATDAASPLFSVSGLSYDGSQTSQKARTRVQLYTDRAIYRPGQKVAFSAVAFTHRGDAYKVQPALQLKATLRNANNKVVDTLLVQTDAFGAVNGEFGLPTACLPGRFSITIDNGSVSGRSTFAVEEYKRPTFTATTQPVTTAYAMGDSVMVGGEAKTYSGVPVADARVQYSVRRTAWFFIDDERIRPQSGETTTDANGHFALPVWLEPTRDGASPIARYNRYTYVVDYTVTAPNGETTQGSTTLGVATRAAWLEVSVPQTIYRRPDKALPQFHIRQLNAQGENMMAEGTYVLTNQSGSEVAEGTFNTHESFSIDLLGHLPSAQYTLRVHTAEAEADSVTFTLLSDTDAIPVAADQPFFFYKEASGDGASARIVLGTTEKDVCLFYDVLTGSEVVESRRIALNNQLIHLTFDYKEAYGDGAVLCVAVVRNGRLYTERVGVTKPKPDKRLLLHWSSFRSRLTPGQHEEWRVQITRPDGSPADAQMMACLYDASLDALAKNTWADFAVNFNRYLPSPSWQTNWETHTRSLYGLYDIKRLAEDAPLYSQWQEALFNYYHSSYGPVYALGAVGPRRMRAMTENAMPMAAIDSDYMAEDAVALNKMAANEAVQPVVVPRTNFAETAFFRPALRTNDRGEVVMAFTLPESMTQWNFTALAHDIEMNYGRLDTTVVARKEFMVEPALPRFLRQGDVTDLPVKVTNLSDKTINAVLTLSLNDALNNKQIHRADTRVELAPGESGVYTFPYQAKGNEGVLVCRAMAQGTGYADGEEHYLPVLTDEVQVTRTLPFSQTAAGVLNLRTDTLFDVKGAHHRALSVELSSNPTWYAVTALPALQGTDGCISADDWATRFYALAIASQVAHDVPEIKALATTTNGSTELDVIAKLKAEELTDATPWLQQGDDERQRGEALRQLFDSELSAARMATAVDKLKTLQQGDGAYSWYPGMGGNAYTTVDVAILLARVETLTDCRQGHSQLLKAKTWLKQYVAEMVSEMKRDEKKYKCQMAPSELAMRYLYLLTLTHDELDDDATYLVTRATMLNKELTMYGKAVVALIMAKNGKKAEADLALKSMLEHTVTKKNLGRWFDTQRAEWAWRSYRIPTQCMAIEALRALGHNDAADEMRLWLLQAKRTQMWETARASSDAVYTLLASDNTNSSVMSLAETTPVYYTLYNQNKVVGLNAKSQSATSHSLGYVKQTYTDEAATNATTLKVDKRTNGLSWGCVYATFAAPASSVQTEGQGLQLMRHFEVKHGNEWVAVNDGQAVQLAKGDRVRQVFTITAERDYDFVSLKASRPACLQPAQPLSGYAWNMSLPAYRAVHDASTDYFVEKLRKGTHQLVEELFVDRTGQFTSGIANIECVYAPEFCGTAAEQSLAVTR